MAIPLFVFAILVAKSFFLLLLWQRASILYNYEARQESSGFDWVRENELRLLNNINNMRDMILIYLALMDWFSGMELR